MSKIDVLKEWALEVMGLNVRLVKEGSAMFFSFYRASDNLFVGCVAKKSEVETWLKGYKAATDVLLRADIKIATKTFHSDALGRVTIPED